MADQPQELNPQQETAATEDAGQRLDVWLTGRLASCSRAAVRRMIDGGMVTVNGGVMRPGYRIVAGDLVEIRPDRSGHGQEESSRVTPIPMPLEILFEDEHIIVINKPAGLTVHPGAGTRGKPTLVAGLLAHCGQLGEAQARPDTLVSYRPGIVHRLDRDTTGAIVCAKTDRAHAALSMQFRDKTGVVREYAALLDGTMAREEIEVESLLSRDPDHRLRFCSSPLPADWQGGGSGARQPIHTGPRQRYARSVFTRVADYLGRLTLARVRLYTGRTHQIRVHSLVLGLPVVGDQLYHRPVQLPASFPNEIRVLLSGLQRQMLHARLLRFRHPADGRDLEIRAPYPTDFRAVIAALDPFRS